MFLNIFNFYSKKMYNQFSEIKEPLTKPLSIEISPNMLAFYHKKNGGTLTKFDEIYFDQNTDWFQKKLILSGISYPKDFFYIAEIPDSPNGIYRLGGSTGGSVKITGSDKIIGII